VLRDTISFEEGASLLINPLTAWLLLEEAKKQHAPAFVQTASSSEAGKMLIRLGRRLGLRSVCIVRKNEQKAALKRLGATEVLSSQRANFPARLRTSCRREKVMVAFDAVGGKLTSAVARALPAGGHVIVYGALAGQPCEIPPGSLIFEDKQLRGFWLTARVKNMSLAEKKRLTDAVQPRLKDDLATAVLARFELTKINEAIAFYKANRSDGKVLLAQGENP
jgi:NADPH:quinone reductase